MSTDPIVLASQARAVLESLHKSNDIVVRFKTNESGYAEDELDDLDKKAPGHFRTDRKVLTLNLDELIGAGKPRPDKLDSIEDFRKFPVLAGVAAHESGHARWSLWGDKGLPETIPNPGFDAFADEEPSDPTDPESPKINPTGPEQFPVSGNGALVSLAQLIEEPRIERLGTTVYTKTWRRAMQLSAGHLILENIEKMDQDEDEPLDAALKMAILVGGRMSAGTLGQTSESRASVKKIMDSAQEIIEQAVAGFDVKDQTEDPFHTVMGLINRHIFNNDHEEPVIHLEAARQILNIIHPERKNDPDEDEGGEDGEGEEGGEGDGSGVTAGASQVLKEMGDKMREGIDALSKEMSELVESEESQPESAKQEDGGHGSIMYKNPRAPQLDRYENPTAADRELYKLAYEWMLQQIEPTVTEAEFGQWLPVGGARLDIRSKIRDDFAGHLGSQRSDWNKVSETVKPAPPVKVGIMLDGSGSMSSMARPSASIAWAVANAAAMLPESRTVSVVYGSAAAVTQEPGHLPARKVAVSRTDGPTEDFIGAAKMVEDALWLDDQVEEGEKANVLIVIVSDLQYGGRSSAPFKPETQQHGFFRIVQEWYDKGYNVVVVGSSDYYAANRAEGAIHEDPKMKKEKMLASFRNVKPEDLFK